MTQSEHSRFGTGITYDPTAYSAFCEMRAAYKSGWMESFAKLQAGDISLAEWRVGREAAIAEMFDKSYRLGLQSTGRTWLTAGDKGVIQAGIRAEQSFLANFPSDLRDGDGHWSVEKRIKMFSRAGDGMFYKAEVSGLDPSTTDVWWDLGESDHCDDCIDLAESSPYNPLAMPSTPRLGDTQCRELCTCELRYVKRDIPRRTGHFDETAGEGDLHGLPDASVSGAAKMDCPEFEAERKELVELERLWAELERDFAKMHEAKRRDEATVKALNEKFAIYEEKAKNLHAETARLFAEIFAAEAKLKAPEDKVKGLPTVRKR